MELAEPAEGLKRQMKGAAIIWEVNQQDQAFLSFSLSFLPSLMSSINGLLLEPAASQLP
jgi:hypothetical protein